MNKLIPAMLLALMASGCSHSSAPQLAGRAFTLQSVDGATLNGNHGKAPAIAFSADMRVSGTMCNRFFGQGELQQEVLTVRQMGSTRMLCSDAQLNAWDRVIGDTLMNGAVVTTSQNSLTLKGGGHTLIYGQNN